MLSTPLALWAFYAMHVLEPPYEAAALAASVPSSRESFEARISRYEAIAEALADVAGHAPPLFDGDRARVRTAALLLTTTWHESRGWARAVDYALDPDGRGDHGRSWCLAQIHIGAGRTPEGWSGPELVADRRRCFVAALRVLRGAIRMCRALPEPVRAAAYLSGRCAVGQGAARYRYGLARMLERRAPPLLFGLALPSPPA